MPNMSDSHKVRFVFQRSHGECRQSAQPASTFIHDGYRLTSCNPRIPVPRPMVSMRQLHRRCLPPKTWFERLSNASCAPACWFWGPANIICWAERNNCSTYCFLSVYRQILSSASSNVKRPLANHRAIFSTGSMKRHPLTRPRQIRRNPVRARAGLRPAKRLGM